MPEELRVQVAEQVRVTEQREPAGRESGEEREFQESDCPFSFVFKVLFKEMILFRGRR